MLALIPNRRRLRVGPRACQIEATGIFRRLVEQDLGTLPRRTIRKVKWLYAIDPEGPRQ